MSVNENVKPKIEAMIDEMIAKADEMLKGGRLDDQLMTRYTVLRAGGREYEISVNLVVK